MKKCEFCGKQISYFDQYCDDECHIKANKFYEKGERFGKLFAVINMICVEFQSDFLCSHLQERSVLPSHLQAV